MVSLIIALPLFALSILVIVAGIVALSEYEATGLIWLFLGCFLLLFALVNNFSEESNCCECKQEISCCTCDNVDTAASITADTTNKIIIMPKGDVSISCECNDVEEDTPTLNNINTIHYCYNCGNSLQNEVITYKFCPECGISLMME